MVDRWTCPEPASREEIELGCPIPSLVDNLSSPSLLLCTNLHHLQANELDLEQHDSKSWSDGPAKMENSRRCYGCYRRILGWNFCY